MLRLLAVEEVMSRWAELTPMLNAAIEYSHGDFLLEDVQRDLIAGTMQLWALENITGSLHSICTTQIIDYDRQRACSIVTATGGIDTRWASAITVIGKWAKARNCVRLEAHARRGWLRRADTFGFKHLDTTIYKEL
jgi:hypothetical protein